MLNPDGVFLGNSRCNFNGVDLNRYFIYKKIRKWDNPKQKTEPEVHYILKSLSKYSNIAFMIDLHGHSKKFNQFLYGCLQGKSVAEYMRIRQFGKLLAQKSEIFSFKVRIPIIEGLLLWSEPGSCRHCQSGPMEEV